MERARFRRAIVAGGHVFKDNLLNGFTEAGSDVDNPLEMFLAIRRVGSGALGLVDVAAGRSEAYCELHINAWDCAAGILLVQEAGGCTNDFFAGEGIIAGNPLIATNQALCIKLAGLIGIPIKT